MLNKMLNIVEGYGFMGSIRLAINILVTWVIFPRARILRMPFYIRNRGIFKMGRGFSCNTGLIINIYKKTSILEIGENVMANHHLHIDVQQRVVIGDNTLLANHVFITDHSHGDYTNDIQSSPLTKPVERPLFSKSVVIGKNCWIGEKVSILPGVHIGDGSIIGANSVVTSRIPDNSIAVGAPAQVIKRFNFHSEKWEGV